MSTPPRLINFRRIAIAANLAMAEGLSKLRPSANSILVMGTWFANSYKLCVNRQTKVGIAENTTTSASPVNFSHQCMLLNVCWYVVIKENKFIASLHLHQFSLYKIQTNERSSRSMFLNMF
jgi:hypothetical protein